jgi:hypothetical protein
MQIRDLWKISRSKIPESERGDYRVQTESRGRLCSTIEWAHCKELKKLWVHVNEDQEMWDYLDDYQADTAPMSILNRPDSELILAIEDDHVTPDELPKHKIYHSDTAIFQVNTKFTSIRNPLRLYLRLAH